MLAEIMAKLAIRVLGDLPPDGRKYWSGMYWDRSEAEAHPVLGPHYLDQKRELLRFMGTYAENADRVVEFCAGTGEFTEMVTKLTAAREITALDISAPGLKKLVERVHHDGLRVVEGDFWDDHDLGTADLVLCADSMQHLGNYDDVLVRMRSFLAPGAVLIANVWTIDNYHELERLRYGRAEHLKRTFKFLVSALLIRLSGGRLRTEHYRTKLLSNVALRRKLRLVFGEVLEVTPGRYHTAFVCRR